MTRRHPLTRLLALCLIALVGGARPAAAALNMAELYLEKIRLGEKTFLQKEGWSHSRNQVEFFYELDMVEAGGTGDPRFEAPKVTGLPLTVTNVGGLALLTPASSSWQLTLYHLRSSADRGSGAEGQRGPGGEAFSAVQSVSGMQFRAGTWIEGSYGLIFDERLTRTSRRSFLELEIPFLYLSFNVDAAPDQRAERVEYAFEFDESTWFDTVSVGRVDYATNARRRFYQVSAERLFNWLTADVRLTEDMELAWARGGVHVGRFDNGDPRRDGKFGRAVVFKAMATAVHPRRANQWSPDFGVDEVLPGAFVELSYQAPLMEWMGYAMLILGAFAAAHMEEGKERDKFIEDTANVSMQMVDAADEDDRVYGALTVRASVNNPEVIKDIPGATDNGHLFLLFRVFY